MLLTTGFGIEAMSFSAQAAVLVLMPRFGAHATVLVLKPRLWCLTHGFVAHVGFWFEATVLVLKPKILELKP